MGRAIRRLRAEGQLAAVVDLTQIAPRGEVVDSARWHYSIAYRVCRELRLRVDLQTWWHDRNLLPGDQRLVEFFWDVVLAHTSEAVTIFIDEAERTVDLPFAHELFAALHSCYMRRVSEPDFSRLNFVVLGAASRLDLCPDPDVSPFTSGRRVHVDDLTPDECAGLAPGLEQQSDVAIQTLARIHAWTRGQPYLTQKLARAVARKGAGADVDSLAFELYLGPNSAREEPLLAHMRGLISEATPRSRHAAATVARLGRGLEIIDDPRSAVHRLLHIGGFVTSDDNGMLRFRNRIVERVFGRREVRHARWRRPLRIASIAAAALGALVVLPLWYVRVLPAADTATLNSARELGAIADAHAQLGRLPGFGGRADRLFGAALVRLGQDVESIAQLRDIDTLLRPLPGGVARADELTSVFWLRRARALASRGDRDTALVHALAASATGSTSAQELAASLIDGDYLKLERSVYLDAPPLAVAADWQRQQIVLVDAAHQAWRIPLGADAGATHAGVQLTALQHVGVTRSLFVDEPGIADGLELRLRVQHPRLSDLLVRLRSPSGAAVEIELPARSGAGQEFVLRAAPDSPLADFAGESIIGQWELTLFDRLSDETGEWLSWGLRFAGVSPVWTDAPVGGLPLPDPTLTEQVDVSLSADGRLGLTLPALADARGAASVWDLSLGAWLTDLPLSEPATAVQWLSPERLLIVGHHRATLWEPRAGTALQELTSVGGFAGQPAVSPDGEFFALAGNDGRAELYRSADGSPVSQFSAAAWQDWVLGPQASFIAGIDGSRRGRVLDPATGALRSEFFHERALVRLFATGVPDRIVAMDAAGDLFTWTLATSRSVLGPADSRYLGAARSDRGVSAAANTVALAFPDRYNHVAVARMTDGRRYASLQHDTPGALWTALSPDASHLLTASNELIRVWSLGSVVEQSADFGDVSALAIARDGQLAVLGKRSGSVQFLAGLPAAMTRAPAAAPTVAHRAVVTALAISAQGTRVASGDSAGAIRLWDVAAGTVDSGVLRHPAGPIASMAFSPDGRWLLTAGQNLVRVFDAVSGDIITEFELEGASQAVAFAADSALIAIGDSAGNIVIASPQGLMPPRTIRRNAPVSALAFAASPALLASGSTTGELNFWDTSSLSMVGETQRFSGPIRWLDLSADASGAIVHSGGWLHRVERTGASVTIAASRLLPEPLRSNPSLTRIGTDAVRALAQLGGGRLVEDDITLAAGEPVPDAATVPVGGRVTVPARDWDRVLGLVLDPASGEIVPERL